MICQSVFQYVPAAEVRRGLRNLAGLCRGAAYLEVVTREDWEIEKLLERGVPRNAFYDRMMREKGCEFID